MIKATFVKDIQNNRSSEKLYRLSEPVETDDGDTTEYVVISALASAMDTGMPETYIFPADSDGNITGWGEMDGSYRGGTSHEKAIADAGWELAQ